MTSQMYACQGALLYLKVIGNFHGIYPPFCHLPNLRVAFYTQLDLIDPIFLQKKSFCLYHI